MRREIDAVALTSIEKGEEFTGLTCFGVDGRTDNNSKILTEVEIGGVRRYRNSAGKTLHTCILICED